MARTGEMNSFDAEDRNESEMGQRISLKWKAVNEFQPYCP